jgi:mannose-6-phosphate isomerase-like protein (cupin superfamily)
MPLRSSAGIDEESPMPSTDWRFSLESARQKLPPDPSVFRAYYGLRHGTMKVGIYAPDRIDAQHPHRQDELYIVIRGSGDFVKDGERSRFAANDVLFVEAGSTHRFENFSDDFCTWVVFWGPEGGERT